MMIKSRFDKTDLKKRIHTTIFESNTYWGKFFDIALLIVIIINFVMLMLDSIASYHTKYHSIFMIIEWILTFLFCIEYALRLYAVKNKKKYALSFYGIIDLLAIIPIFFEYFIPGTQFLLALRVMRLLRIFIIFKLVRFLDERNTLANSLKASWYKISYFLFFILITVCVIGTLMYLIEGSNPESGFVNIPVSIYWSIVTLTTVGYGDISPITPLGQLLASCIMILGYSIIAVPTGIVTSELTRKINKKKNLVTEVCQNCSEENHFPNSKFCHRCGSKLV